MTAARVNKNYIIGAWVLLSALVFFIDLQLPLGISMGVPYASLVLLTLWINGRKYTVIATIASIILTVVGGYLSPRMPTFDDVYIGVTNRSLTVGVILISAFLVFKYKKSEKLVESQHLEVYRLNVSLKEANAELEKKVKVRTLVLEEAIETLSKTKAELNEALKKERELNDLKMRFVSMASHEFRTPLATILSSLALVIKYGEQNEKERQIKHFRRIKDSVNSLTDIINDVLSVSKLEEGKIPILYEQFDMRDYIHSSLSDLKAIAKEGQVLHYSHTGDTIVIQDKKALKHILLNLVSNAVKFSPPHSPIDVCTEVGDSTLKLTVKDNGIGISEEDQEHLFERFFRAENASNIQGTGLGLNIVAKFIEILKGDIHFTSRLNEGTTFYITLPLVAESRLSSKDLLPDHRKITG